MQSGFSPSRSNPIRFLEGRQRPPPMNCKARCKMGCASQFFNTLAAGLCMSWSSLSHRCLAVFHPDLWVNIQTAQYAFLLVLLAITDSKCSASNGVVRLSGAVLVSCRQSKRQPWCSIPNPSSARPDATPQVRECPRSAKCLWLFSMHVNNWPSCSFLAGKVMHQPLQKARIVLDILNDCHAVQFLQRKIQVTAIGSREPRKLEAAGIVASQPLK